MAAIGSLQRCAQVHDAQQRPRGMTAPALPVRAATIQRPVAHQCVPRSLLASTRPSAARDVRAGVVTEKTDLADLAAAEPLMEPIQESPISDETVPSLFERNAVEFKDKVALVDPHKEKGLEVTYGELWTSMIHMAAGLRSLGLTAGERVSLFSENSSRWMVADQAVHLNGCCDAVRGSTAPLDELAYIMNHSKSSGIILQDVDALKKMAPALSGPDAPDLKFVIVMWGDRAAVDAMAEKTGLPASLKLHTHGEVLAMGEAATASAPFVKAPVTSSDLATLVYTSGTTGHPKGVMLSHGNLMYQIGRLGWFLPVTSNNRTLSLLPPWHIYERATSYYIMSTGATQVYTNIRKFKDDLPKYKPDYFVCVPLVLDTLHSKVMANLRNLPTVRRVIATTLLNASQAYVRAQRTAQGVDLRFAREPAPAWTTMAATILAALLAPLNALAQKLVFAKIRDAVGIKSSVVSGGGALAPHLDDFYEAMGLEILNGWGLSETSPVLACRVSTKAQRGPNVRGSIGYEVPGTQLRVVDPESFEDLPDGTPGLILARGPGVMQGYLDDADSTAKAFKAGDRWFDTGDLGWRAPQGIAGSNMAGNMVLTGRAKDTIVMANGKNVEPEPIEGAVQCSPLVKHIIMMGQDKRELGALVFPDEEALEALAESRGSMPEPAELESMLLEEVSRLNAARPDYHAFDHVAHISVVRTPLSVEDGTLTRTMKPRRPEIAKVYAEQQAALMKRLRG